MDEAPDPAPVDHWGWAADRINWGRLGVFWKPPPPLWRRRKKTILLLCRRRMLNWCRSAIGAHPDAEETDEGDEGENRRLRHGGLKQRRAILM